MMKKALSFVLFLFSIGVSAQSLYNTTATGWVNLGDLDVAGDQLTVEAIITMTGPSINIVSKHTNPADVNYLLRPGSFEITTTSGFANFSGIASAGVTLNLNECYHLAATYDGQMLRYYVNGCLTGSMAWTGNMVQNDLLTAIGNQSSCECEALNGYIDEVRIWNVARTQTEIQLNMNDLPTPATQAGLLGYYKFDGNYLNLQGNTAFDGTPLNGATIQNNVSCTDPAVLSSNVSGTDVYCYGTSTGSIQVNANGGYTPYTYSIDGVNYQSSYLFNNLPAGNYTAYAASNPNCIVTQNITISQPPAILLDTIFQNVSCFGQNNGNASVLVQGGIPPYTYQWNTVPAQTTPNASNLTAGTYQVTVTDNSCVPSGIELVTNGDFSLGNTSFSSSYTYCNTSNCVGEAMYAIGSPAYNFHNSFTGTDHTTGTGSFMIVNGSSSPTNVWCQTVNVTANTDYNFSCWLATLYAVNPAELQFTINGVSIGNILNAPLDLNQWIKFSSTWNSGSSITATICITNLNTQLSGNDFGLDDISFTSCTKSCSKTTTVTINQPPLLSVALSSSLDSICIGDSTTITAVVSGGTTPYSLLWNSGSDSSSITVSPSNTTIYSFTVTDFNGCSITDSVEITVNPLPVVNLGPDGFLCQGDTMQLNAGASFSAYNWNTGEITQTINVNTQDSFSVNVTDFNGCQNSASLFVTLNPLPFLYLGADTQLCAGSAILDAGPGMVSYLWNTGATAQSIIVSTTGSYSVVITDPNNCQSSDTVLITVYPNPDVILPDSAQACAGESIIIDAGAGFSAYNWNSGEITQIVTFTTSGNYIVTVTDINGCQDQDSVNVAFHALPVADLGPDPIICADSSIILSPGTFVSYQWSNSSTTPTIEVNLSDTYWVTVTDTNNCQGTDSVFVTVNSLPFIELGPDLDICEGSQITLDAGNGLSSFLWSTGENTPTISVQTTGKYSVDIADNNGCKNNDQVVITVNPNPTATLGNDTVICAYSPFILNPGNAASYQWQDGSTSPTYSVNQSGTYSVTLTNIYNCTDTDQVTLIVYQLPVIDFNSVNTQGCPPLSSSFADSSTVVSGNNVSWLWNFGDGNTATGTAVTHDYISTGFYDVSLTVVSSQGCTATAVLNNHIEVYPEPIANFTALPEETSVFEPSIQFYNESIGADDYQWDFGDLNYSNEINPKYLYSDSGNYEVTLIVNNTQGCLDTAYNLVRVNPEFVLFFPNAFTPNGKGLNEVFLGYGEGISEYDLRIFNRWGEEIFQSNDLYKGWDGKVNGQSAPQGIYVFLCTGKNFKGKKFSVDGHVTLIR